jgi:MscS family membrane protein
VSLGLDHSFLFRRGPLDLLGWQWLALPALFFLAWLLGLALSRLTRKFFGRAAQHTATPWDDAILGRMGKPLTVAWAIASAYALLVPLDLQPRPEDLLHRGLKAAALVTFFWALERGVEVGRQITMNSTWIKERPSARSLIPLSTKICQIFLLALGVVALLSELGYPVASLVAGLGIGGLAVALAAQKTLENLFGAVALGTDQPFREGDFVNIEGVLGTVESIGLRSTRIRTLERTLITIPNGKLAEMRLESFAARDRLRLACTLGLVYGTSAVQVRQVVAGLERVLRGQPKLWPEGVTVRLKELGASSLVIDVGAWFGTTNWDEFMLIREQVLLDFMQVIEDAGSALVVPARAVQLVDGAALRPEAGALTSPEAAKAGASPEPPIQQPRTANPERNS